MEMKRFIKKITIGAGIFGASVVFVVLPISFLIPYDKDYYLRAFFIKERMVKEHDNPTVFLLGGSNVAFGYNCKEMEEGFGMPVVNLGLHAGFGLKFIVDHAVPHLKEGDILILSPEYGTFFQGGYFGGEALADLFYLSKGKILEYLNVKQMKVIVKETTISVVKRVVKYIVGDVRVGGGVRKGDDPYRFSEFDEYGDFVGHRGKSSSGDYPHVKPFTRPVDRDVVEYVCGMIEELRGREVKVCLLPPAFAETSYGNVREDLVGLFDAFEERGVPFEAGAEEMVFPDSLFFDTHYHLNGEGIQWRTRKTIELLEGRLGDQRRGCGGSEKRM
jgi:hypothetical protein